MATETTLPSASRHRIDPLKSIPFFGVHALAVLGVLWLGWSWKGFALAIALYYVRMFGVTAGYHRYFSHKTFKTTRAFQFFLAFLAQSSAQKGALWWASHHRLHHLKSDKPGDVHSVKLDGFLWSHVGWILSNAWDETEESRIRDLVRYPELVWLNRWFLVPPVALGVGLFLVGGWWALVWGMFVSTSLLWHGTFTINSLSHVFGNRRYATTDESKNNFILALVTMGEGWHNNHHHYAASARQGFFWWEIDPSFYVLKVLSWLGLVWDLKGVPEGVRRPAREAAEGAARARSVSAATAPLDEGLAPSLPTLRAQG